MARKPIVFYTRRDDTTGDIQVLDEPSFNEIGIPFEELLEAVPGGLQRYTVHLKEEFRQNMQDVVNNGCIDDPSRRPHLMFAQYVASHDVPDAVRLEPVVFALIANEIEARVFPTLWRSPDFLAGVRSVLERRHASSPVLDSTKPNS